MGCGKSTVGRLVAERSDAPFHDLDARIENEAGMPVAEIFAKRGEEEFRSLESRLLPQLLEPGAVVALGGGATMNDSNWRLIQDRSATVFLDCRFDTIWERIGAGGRPLVVGRSRDELEALMLLRLPRYLEAAHLVNAERAANVVANEILALWSD